MRHFSDQSETNRKPVILITGCGSGLGLAIAQLLSTYDQYRIVITARSTTFRFLKLRFKESERLLILPLDVTSAEDRKAVIDEVDARWGGVDILINNAGVCYRSVVEHMTDDDESLQLATNYLGPMSLIRLVLPSMRRKGRGKIINISSVSGMLAMPTMAAYSASKHALEGACEALWYECKPLGIDVCLVQPGFIKSESFQSVRYTDAADLASFGTEAYHDYYSNMTPFIERLMKLSRTTPECIAQLVLKLIQKQRPTLWIPATPDAVIFNYLRRILSRPLLLNMLYFALPRSTRWGKSYSRKRKFSLHQWLRPLKSAYQRIDKQLEEAKSKPQVAVKEIAASDDSLVAQVQIHKKAS